MYEVTISRGNVLEKIVAEFVSVSHSSNKKIYLLFLPKNSVERRAFTPSEIKSIFRLRKGERIDEKGEDWK